MFSVWFDWILPESQGHFHYLACIRVKRHFYPGSREDCASNFLCEYALLLLEFSQRTVFLGLKPGIHLIFSVLYVVTLISDLNTPPAAFGLSNSFIKM